MATTSKQGGFDIAQPFFRTGVATNKMGIPNRGKHPAHKATNFGNVAPVQLRGRTDADYSNNRWALVNEGGRQGSGCEGCTGRQYVGYSACQRQRIQDAITNVLPRTNSSM
ncbi:MAG: hypothetical protein IPM82_28510 [Saprospiraceae bacterium]|nr:hypothetical protein [Saprospiraceae bacterium]